MDALHEIYGPVVRIAPNEVAIDDAKAIKDICERNRERVCVNNDGQQS